MAPQFSVLMTSYNYEGYVTQAVESVIAQTLDSWELIVVDDASRDSSWAVLQRFANHPRIHLHRNPESLGVAQAYNEALARSTGELITNLDSDDLFRPDLLKQMKAAAANEPAAEVFACFVAAIDESGTAIPNASREAWFNQMRDLNDPQTWVWANPVCHNGSVIRRAAHEAVGPMSTKHHPAPDWDLWIRLLAAGHTFSLVPSVLVESRVHRRAVTGSANERLVADYALTSAQHLHPWLLALGRQDLVTRNIEGFLRRPEFRTGSPEYAAGIVAQLHGDSADTSLAIALQEWAQGNVDDRYRAEQEQQRADACAKQLASAEASLAQEQRKLQSATGQLQRLTAKPILGRFVSRDAKKYQDSDSND